MYLKRNNFFSLVVYLLLAVSCANVVAPTGGPKDEQAPKVLSVLPSDSSVLFSAKEIVFEFDEYIKLVDQNNIQINPLLAENQSVKYEISGKKLNVVFSNGLSSNTTYSIAFNNAVVDYNEGNPIKDFKYIFSTGSQLDSFIIAGRVEDYLTKKLISGVSVFLAEVGDYISLDSLKFVYKTKTAENGEFHFKNLQKKKFNLYAVLDKNNDNKIGESEQFSTLGKVIESSLNQDSIVLLLGPISLIEDRIKEFRTTEYGKVKLVVQSDNKKLIRLLNSNSNYFLKSDVAGDSLFIYHSSTNDSLRFQLQLKDRILDTIIVNSHKDTLEFNKLIKNSISLYGIPYKYSSKDTLTIYSSTPIKYIDSQKVNIIVGDSILKFKSAISLAGRVNFIINYIGFGTAKLILDSASVIDFLGRTNLKTDTLFIDIPDAKAFAKMELTGVDSLLLKNPLIELLNSNKEVVAKFGSVNKQKVDLNFIESGTYTIRITEDSNNNGQIDSWILNPLTYPEKVWISKDIITVKPNWEYEFNLKTLFPKELFK